MSVHPLSRNALLNWARSKNPKERFSPHEGCICALAQYGQFLGFENAVGGTDAFFVDRRGGSLGKPYVVQDVNSGAIFYKQFADKHRNMVNTFGHFAEALEKYGRDDNIPVELRECRA